MFASSVLQQNLFELQQEVYTQTDTHTNKNDDTIAKTHTYALLYTFYCSVQYKQLEENRKTGNESQFPAILTGFFPLISTVTIGILLSQSFNCTLNSPKIRENCKILINLKQQINKTQIFSTI